MIWYWYSGPLSNISTPLLFLVFLYLIFLIILIFYCRYYKYIYITLIISSLQAIIIGYYKTKSCRSWKKLFFRKISNIYDELSVCLLLICFIFFPGSSGTLYNVPSTYLDPLWRCSPSPFASSRISKKKPGGLPC